MATSILCKKMMTASFFHNTKSTKTQLTEISLSIDKYSK